MDKITNKIFKGSGGDVWINGEHLANVKDFEAKVKGEFSDVQCCGSLGTGHLYTGYDGSGKISLHKINSKMAVQIAKAYQSGIMPEIKIITNIKNALGQNERVAVSGVVFEEVTLINMAEKKGIEEQFPFKFSEYEFLERAE